MTLQAATTTTTTNLLARSQLRTQLLKSEAATAKSDDQESKRPFPFTSSSFQPVAKVTESSSIDRQNRLFEPGRHQQQSASEQPSELKRTLFRIILFQIKLLIAIVRFLNVTCLQVYYLVYYYLERLKHSRHQKSRSLQPQTLVAAEDSSLSFSGGRGMSLMSSTLADDDHCQSKDSLFSSNESSLCQKTENSSLNTSRPPNTFSLSANSSLLSTIAHATPFAQENNFKIPDLVHVPSHVCVIFNEFGVKHEYDLFECISKVMSANEVKMLSFYSFKDIPNDIKSQILSRFQVRPDENNNNATEPCKIDNDFKYNEAVINNHKVKVTNPKNEEAETRGTHAAARGTTMTTKIRFLSFDANGGQSVLAKVARNMATKVNEDLMSLGEINQEMIETHIIEAFDFVEPQLVISIGESDSLAGFSPWHLRLCEIFKVQSARLINVYTLRDILVKFSKIEKRFGK